MVVDLRKERVGACSICIIATDWEIVQTYKYLRVHLDNKFEWSTNIEIGVRAIFFAVVSWGTGIKAKDAIRLKELRKNAGSVVGPQLATLEEVVKQEGVNRNADYHGQCFPSPP